jgi:hypothetical protein
LKANFLETEYQSDPSRIHYIYDLGNREPGKGIAIQQQNITYEEMLKLVFTPAGTPVSLSKISLQNQREGGLKLGPRGFVSK